ncbi:SusC/RagA family TonB-linked outer membrane protein [Fulvitalea axinellae]|uniref:SusC/RagA family TonB-linked outer membrane protein n=1 Tax=Fulvitalea axinellae TaxID=1182444 RepID=A0AAU9CF17_9BACT|nr:SusC/RagA family TonB-linked outer membrane protein [Fulvitalea axinellae]
MKEPLPKNKILRRILGGTAMLFFLVTLFAAGQARSETIVEKEKHTVNFKASTLRQVFEYVRKNSDMDVFFAEHKVDVNTRVNFEATGIDTKGLLELALRKTPYAYKVVNNHVVISPRTAESVAQDGAFTVSGTITDKEGETLVGVNVIIKGTTQGTVTDVDGKFSLQVKKSDVLLITFVGHKPQELSVGNRQTFDIVLEEDLKELEAVVVVGYGEAKQINLSGAVATVKPEKLEARSVANVSSALSGMLPGVRISTRNGGRVGGESISIQVRGQGSMSANNSPMVVVDGVESSLSDLDPNDIESMSVLKDASSSAIYGSRAANGVIVVTTKSGKAGQMKMEYHAYAGWQQATNVADYVSNSAEYMEMFNKFRPGLFQQADIDEWRNADPNDLAHPNVDWMDEQVGRSALMQSHNFAFSGGSDVTRYRFSLSYLDQEGLSPGNEQQRYTFRTNVETNMTPNLIVGANAFLRWREVTPGMSDGINYGLAPMISNQQLPDGTWLGSQNSTLGSATNPYATVAGRENTKLRRSMRADIFVNWEALPGLRLQTRNVIDYNNNFQRQFYPLYETYNIRELDPEGNPKLDADRIKRSSTNEHKQDYKLSHFATATYTKSLGKHNFSVLAGHEIEVYRWENLKGKKDVFASDDVDAIGYGLQDPSVSGDIYEANMESYFGSLDYNFSEKYLFKASMRADASSRFREGKRWGYFPSLSAGWRISEEAFMQDLSFVNNLKIRGSWGVLGNQRINTSGGSRGSYYPYQDLYNKSPYVFGGNIHPGQSVTRLVDSDISWESTEMVNLAIDATLFRTFNITAEVFQKRTYDIITKLQVPTFLGAKDSPYTNLAEMTNRGLELNLSYEGQVGELRYQVGANGTYIENEVTGYNVDLETSNIRVGEPYGFIRGYESRIIRTQEQLDNAVESGLQIGDLERIDQLTVDTDGDGVMDAGDGKINHEDQMKLHSGRPTWTYGGNVNLFYKNFELNLLFQGVTGMKGSWVSQPNAQFPVDDRGLVHEMWRDATDEDNPNGEWPRLNKRRKTQNLYHTSSFWIRDLSYFRLKNLMVAYNIPKDVISKIGFSKAKVYFTSENLFTASDYFSELGFDPETRNSGGIPNTTTYMLGVKVQF